MTTSRPPTGAEVPQSSLAAFLTALRARTDPGLLGLPRGRGRRVPGLRRAEVAVFAGLSVDYYTRLEQGRERHPSGQVLDAVASALVLTPDERRHLFALAEVVPTSSAEVSEGVAPSLARLMAAWSTTPALVVSPAHDVVAANALARALYAPMSSCDTLLGTNMLETVFLDPLARSSYQEWETAAAASVASLRAVTAHHGGDPRVVAVVETLLGASPEFTTLWQRQEVRPKRYDVKRFVHPQVGRLELAAHTFTVNDAPGLQLVVYDAEPGSPSSDGLQLLAGLAGTVGSVGAPTGALR